MSRIVLVRHGETVWHGENRYAGRTDIALSERGVAQAQLLGEWARRAGLRAVWSSPLQRAVQTAEPAATAAGLTLRIEPRLIEVDFGRGEGMTNAEMEAEFPAERAAFVAAPASCPLPGGEDSSAAVERGMQALAEIAQGEGPALVVAHNTLMRLLLCHVLGVSLDRYRKLFAAIENATLTELDFGHGAVGLVRFNAPLPGADEEGRASTQERSAKEGHGRV